MLRPAIPPDEAARLRRLRSLDLLDGASEDAIDAFTRLASDMTGMPISLVSLVDADRQWFKSAVGCIQQGCETHRDMSFCGHAILQDGIFEVENALEDWRFADNPLVVGELRVIHYAGAPIVMPDGERIGSFCVIDHKPGKLQWHQRELLLSLSRMLVHVLLMREKDRAQTRIAQEAAREADRARQAAEAANAAKSSFLATMSHEIRTPINGVIGLTTLLGHQSLPGQSARYVRSIESCANSLLALVDNVLDFSKIEAGKVIVEEQDIDLYALVDELAQLQTLRAQEKNLAFRCHVAPLVPRWVRADGHRLRQVLLNLLGNAWKFTATGGYSLHVGNVDQLGRLRFEVRDSGIGVSFEDQARLFQRFTQADASTTSRFKGTGLGLAIAKELVELMGGDIRLVSHPGAGSTFTVELPSRPAKATSTTEGAAAVAIADVMRVLVVDDNEVNLLVAEGLLQTLGCTAVTCVADGRAAVDACLQGGYDLVFMDCQMPEMDGFEATRQLRAAGYARPIVALTATATLEDKEACLRAGMDAYLTKPISPVDLSSALQRFHSTQAATAADAGLVTEPDPTQP